MILPTAYPNITYLFSTYHLINLIANLLFNYPETQFNELRNNWLRKLSA
jgi:hypothetical protein